VKGPKVIHPSDRPSTSPYTQHINLRQVDPVPVLLTLPANLRLSTGYYCEVRCCAAHVEGHQVKLARERTQPCGTDHPGSRTRGDQ
jgi:hypothetical protein